MKYKEPIFSIIVSTILTLIFFFPVLKGLVPFPGDLLIGEYQPWRSYSFNGYAPGGVPNKAQYFDTLRQLYPWKTFVTESLKKGIIPWWNPHNFSGSPLLANVQSAVFSPTHIVFLFLPITLAWTVSVMLQHWISILGCYWYCRQKNISLLGSWFAALTFAFSAFASVWSQYNTIVAVISYLPWILLFIERIKKTHSTWSFILLATAVASSAFSGHIQLFGAIFLISIFYILFIESAWKKRLLMIIPLVLGVGIASIQLIPTSELISFAARSPYTTQQIIETNLVQPWQLITLLVPDFFGNPATRNYWLNDTYIGKVLSAGITAVILFFLFIQFRKARDQKFFLWLLISTLLLVTRNPISVLLYQLPIPLISSSSPTLFNFLITFSLAIIGGFTITQLQTETKIRILLRSIVPIGTMLVLLTLIMASAKYTPYQELASHAHITLRNLMLWGGFFTIISITLLCLHIAKWKSYIIIGLLIFHTLELVFSFRKFNPFVPPSYVFPQTELFTYLQNHQQFERYWSYGSGTIEANIATAHSLYSIDGYDPLYPKWYGEFLHANKDGTLLQQFSNTTRSDAVIGRSGTLLSNSNRKKILDLLNVTYYIQKDEDLHDNFFPSKYPLVYQANNWRVYENKDALPKIFFAKSVDTYSDKEDFSHKFFSPDFIASETILLSDQLGDQIKPRELSDSIHILSYKPNTVDIETSTSGPRLLFLSDTYYPSWRAYINNIETPIYRANYAFRAIVVPEGNNKIQFRYVPRSGIIGSVMSILSIIVLCFYAYFNKKIYRHIS